MRAIQYVIAALVCCSVGRVCGFFGYDAYHDARSSYYEMITDCERDGGECISVNFGPDPTPPPTFPPTYPPTKLVPIYIKVWQTTKAPRPTTRAPRPTTKAPRPTTRAPRHTTRAPRPTTRAPRPITRARRPTTRAPRLTTRAPRPTTQAPRQTTKTPNPATRAPRPKTKKLRRKGQRWKARRRNPEYEGVERKKRAIWGPGPWDYLYSECTGGWEFDLGCNAKGKTVCCHSSSPGY